MVRTPCRRLVGGPHAVLEFDGNEDYQLYLAPAGTTKWSTDQCANDPDGSVDPDERSSGAGVRRVGSNPPEGSERSYDWSYVRSLLMSPSRPGSRPCPWEESTKLNPGKAMLPDQLPAE
jgi:hypothetical protein